MTDDKKPEHMLGEGWALITPDGKVRAVEVGCSIYVGERIDPLSMWFYSGATQAQELADFAPCISLEEAKTEGWTAVKVKVVRNT